MYRRKKQNTQSLFALSKFDLNSKTEMGRKMKNSIKKVLGFMLAIALIVGMIPTFASNVYAEEGKWIYVDGVNGSDSNDGSEGSPVQSWAKAKELLGCVEGGIYVVGTVDASGEISTKNPAAPQVVKRTSDIVMFNVSGEATFANIVVDGEDKEFDSEVVHPNSGSKVNFLSGAVFQRIGYLEDVSGNIDASDGYKKPYSTKGGRVSSLEEHVTILIDGATFCNNKGKGIFWTPWTSPYGDGKNFVTLTMKSGVVTGNWGHFYFNEQATSNNVVRIYNALVTGNDTTYSSQRYDRPVAMSAVHVCNEGLIQVRNLDGAAIFGNSIYDIEQESGIERGSNLALRGNTSAEVGKEYNKMLGGGNPNWSDIIEWDNPGTSYTPDIDAYQANPSDADKAAARAAARSIFEGNKSVVFDSNGIITFGRYDSETIPNTPAVEPTMQGCDDTPTPEEPKEFEVEISKVEVNGTEELPGAELKIESSDVEGFETISWTSGTETKKVTLKPGTYTMTETQAPEHYEIAESITFVVSEDGKVTIGGSEVSLVRMEDARKEEPKDEEENPEEEPKDEEPKDEEPKDEEPKEEEPKEEEPKNEEPPVEEPKEEKPEELPPPNVPSTGNPETPANNTPAPSNNTPPPTNNTPGVPVTGVSNNIMLWVVLGAVASIIAVTTMGLRKR